MKIGINVDALGKSVNDYIGESLEAEGLPPCLGMLYPPVALRIIELEDEGLLVHKNTIPKDEIILDDVSELVLGDKMYDEKYTITKEGAEAIEEYKKETSIAYTKKLLKCKDCATSDLCDKLTKNYLRLLSVKERI